MNIGRSGVGVSGIPGPLSVEAVGDKSLGARLKGVDINGLLA